MGGANIFVVGHQKDKIINTAKNRFFAKILLPNKNGCMEYIGAISKTTGYVNFGFNYKSYLGHRFSYELFIGKIGKNLQVLHRCDNRICVAPEHLYLGTQADNIRDMCAKKRNKPCLGEDSPHAKITRRDVLQMRKEFNKGSTLKEQADKYKLGLSTVANIRDRRTWKHI
jgi:hypothetical protein